jgi:DNA-binding transcriptional LysR family regulator
MRISLRQIAIFDAVARTGSVSRGADEIALSQSAASAALKELEDGLGVTLFHRHGRALSLNENGRRLQPMARSLLAQAREIERISPDADLSGVLRIAAADCFDDDALGRVCAAFLRRHPQAQLKLERVGWQQVLDRVDQMSCDLGFVPAPCNRPGLTFTPVVQDELVVFCAPGHRLAGVAGVSIADLAAERWCLRQVGSAGRHHLTMALGAASNGISIALETSCNATLKSAVRAGLGLGCLSRGAVAAELEDRRLVALDLPDLPLRRLFGVVTPARTYRDALQAAFRSLAIMMLDDGSAGGLEAPLTAVLAG